MERYDVLYTRNNLSKLVARAEAGEEIEISRRGKPVAKIVPIAPAENKYWTGKQIVEWLEANPIPASQRKMREEIDAIIRDIAEGREDRD
ncbi:MAG: type II toxin-antitoxin system prevent-host-death family antitoxin [Herbiconiux sp.]|uniref:type II toxin-antitoxin system Phd/YefM family antitoxin n=1 Tax=Herbiconiux sp. TaxID=1871186 RepID=UPI00120067F1|nr:type II toxin-antitoxin system prevent-host-death family antitoxin [Herbiconiux sp.]TAJ49114.1 MAG: type II toxin-antitoxin system prevent-host-death family antitoxin [Herbiconiux sp.]